MERTTSIVESLERRRLLSAAADHVAGELLVGFESGLSAADVAQFYADHGLRQGEPLGRHLFGSSEHLHLVNVPAAQEMSLIPALERDPRVRYAEPNRIVAHTVSVPADPGFATDWALVNTGQTAGTPDADIDADEAWDITTGSSDVVVAVIDSGVDYTHPDLAANMWHNPGEIPNNGLDDEGNGFVDDYYGYDAHNNDSDPMDDVGHGTHMAGIIGMVGDNGVGSAGVNWGVKIMAVKATGTEGATIAQIVGAFDYVAMMRLRGVNIRVSNESITSFDYDIDGYFEAHKDASDALGAAGILEVAGAGNEARDIDPSPVDFIPARFESPHIISVAATDEYDRISALSNWGARHVDLAAPGQHIYSTWLGGGYLLGSGTSQATAFVSGAAALVCAAFPNLTALQVKARLLNSVDPIGHIGGNAGRPTVTNGRINVRNALVVDAPDAGDTTAPSKVANLTAFAATPWSVKLNWIASGDDGMVGRAGFYDVRYSTAPITAANFDSATRAAGEPAPAAAGTAQALTVTGLEPGTVYYFAVKVADNAHNESGLSVVQSSTGAARFLVNDGAESAAGPWTATGMWHRSTRRGHDSATAWYYGDESTGTYFNGTQDSGTLTLASPIDLTGVSQALLRFQEWRQVANQESADVARVQLSRDGVNWDTPYETFFATLGWEQRAVDLTPYAGGVVHVRFEFNKNDFGLPPFAMTRGHEGWHIDNVQVLVPAAVPAPSQPSAFSVNDVTLNERSGGGTTQATFTITRSRGNGLASVHYATADGSATTAAGDYVAATGLVSFANGETRKTVTVNVNADQLGEADESFLLNLSAASGAIIADSQGRASVLDDEPRIHIDSKLIIPEGNDRMTFVLWADLTAPAAQTVTVSYATADGTAIAKDDYAAVQGLLTFAPGQTHHDIAIDLPKDKKVEDLVEFFFVELANASANAVILKRGIVHIVDDDVPAGNGGGAAQARLASRLEAATHPAIVWSTLPLAGDCDDWDNLAAIV